MLLSGFNDVQFINVTILGEIIMWFFVILAVLTFLLFLFNLVFIRPGSYSKKELSAEMIEQTQEFEDQKNEVDIEVNLILRVEEERLRIAQTKNNK